MFSYNVEDALNVNDLRVMAQKRLPKCLFEFVVRGTEDEVALRNNRAAFDRATVIVGSSFRRGSDVVKALAIGAKLVMIGRPTLWGTAIAGEAGEARAICTAKRSAVRSPISGAPALRS